MEEEEKSVSPFTIIPLGYLPTFIFVDGKVDEIYSTFS